ncbi:unnamed protein product [Nippostrongylus brasiliensis]|uniref:Molybdenum cofactor sulfurase (inferred by orthology to a C. elegans protein) n=1 Tax=Nippostrongylus brasiliensis TaxID=27835 RepID=A0A158QYB5_NIPBR|nr:unnamed protein product [Nippostrongylus brasiliensis]
MPYLDHAGAALPSEQQLREVFELALRIPLANPHSHHATATTTHMMVQDARFRILDHFDVTTEEYAVVFTANATHALQIVAECFVFNEKHKDELRISTAPHGIGPTFAYMRDSHNSVVGMREIIKEKVQEIVCVDSCDDLYTSVKNGLFAMTAMSNFSGKKYDLRQISKLSQLGWSVCLDAASWVSTSPLSLKEVQPHFVAISFYKLFGYPTGLGALLVRRVTLEHGTLNFYAISALSKGFEDLKRYGGMQKINEKTTRIASEAYRMLKEKTYWNGKPVAEIYGWENAETQGPIVAFNLLRDDGSVIGYSEVARMASLFGIDLRTGCFCNSGACQMYLKQSNEQLLHYFEEGKECGDSRDVIDGRPTGAVRISFGRQSTSEDVAALEQMIEYCFLRVEPAIDIYSPLKINEYSATISRITIYPVKSCRGIDMNKCELTRTGLRHDREFMVECCGSTLTQKKHQQLCKIVTHMSKCATMLTLSNADDEKSSVRVPLEHNGISSTTKGAVICVDRKMQVNREFTHLLPDSSRSLSNEAPYLVVNEASVSVLADVVGLSTLETIARFRPNIVVRGIPPFLEDTATFMTINNIRFEVTKKCTRCEMICVNPITGVKDPQLIVALRNFRQREKMTFGIYVRQIGEEAGEIHQHAIVHFE